MSFDDLQKNWNDQRFDRDPIRAQALLTTARAAEQQFRSLVLVAAVRDGMFVVFFIWGLLARWHGSRVPPAFVLALVIVWAVATTVLLRFSGTLVNSLVGGVGALGSRVDCDGARFRRLLAWRNWREVVFGYWMVGSLSLQAAHQTGVEANRLWGAAVALFVAVTLWLVRIRRISSRRPRVETSVAGQLTLSSYYARAQMDFMGHLGWYFFLAFIAMLFLSAGPLLSGKMTPVAWTISRLSAGLGLYGTYWLNRWIAQVRIRPRYEHLESLRTELLKAG